MIRELADFSLELVKPLSIRVKEFFTITIPEISSTINKFKRKYGLLTTVGALISGCTFGGDLNVNWDGNAHISTITPTATILSTPIPVHTATRIPVTPVVMYTPTATSTPGEVKYSIHLTDQKGVILTGYINSKNGKPVCDLIPFSVESGNFIFKNFDANTGNWTDSSTENREERVVYLVGDVQTALKTLIISKAGKFNIPKETFDMMSPLFPDESTFIGTIPDTESLWWFALQSEQTGDIELHSQLGLQIKPKDNDPTSYFSSVENNKGLVCFTNNQASLQFTLIRSLTVVKDGVFDAQIVEDFSKLGILITP